MAGNERKVWIRRLAAVGLAYLFLLSLQYIIRFWDASYGAYGVGLFGYNIWSVLGLVLAAWLLNRMFLRQDKRLHGVSAASGLLMSVGIVYGTYAHFVNDIFQSLSVCFRQIALILGVSFVAIPLSEEILLLFDKLQRWGGKRPEEKPRKRVTFFVVWFLIFVSYIPAFLGWWPGNFVYDAPFQLQEVIHGAYETHHPLAHTLLMGWAYKLGVAWGDASTGFQFYTLFQMLLLSAAFAYCVYYLYKKALPRVFWVLVLLWFMCFPMHAMFSITATKDVLFAAFFLWFLIFVVRLIFDGETFRWYSYAGLIVTGGLCVLFRNNAVYAIAAGGILVILLEGKGWKRKGQLALLLAAVCLAGNLADAGLAAATDAQTTDSYRETLSVPLQCLARVASYRRADLQETDYAEICLYLEESTLSTYNPYLADNIKSTANEALLKENFFNFMKLWVKIGLQFPDEYLESIITNTMGYWYPLDRGEYASGTIEFYHKLMWTEHEIEKRDYCPLASSFYGELYWQGKYDRLPVLGYLHRMDGWVWFLFYFLFWCVYQKKRAAGLVGAIPLMYLGTCFFGPVAVLRYIYCLVVIVPLLLYVILRSRRGGVTVQTGQ